MHEAQCFIFQMLLERWEEENRTNLHSQHYKTLSMQHFIFSEHFEFVLDSIAREHVLLWALLA